MLTGDIHPKTLDGVKSLAAQLRKEQGIKHSAALDLAAKAANCANFRNAQRTLPARGTLFPRPYVLLTIYWRDKNRQYQCGRETLRIELTAPILELCPKPKLKFVRGFGNLRMAAEDHFVCDTVADTQEYARESLCTAERSLRFLEHTGLHPAPRYRKNHPAGAEGDKLPGIDHETDWVDPKTGQFILVDEPYKDAPNSAERAGWEARTGWRICKASWPGMYYPYSCELNIVTDTRTGYAVEALVAKINAMPAPTQAGKWTGASSSSWDLFVSPMARTSQDRRRARCKGTRFPTASKSTVPYSYTIGRPQLRRPAGELKIEGHKEAGRIIKAALRAGSLSAGAFHRLSSLRHDLEDWMALEIAPGQLDGPEFFEVYYSEGPDDKRHRTRAQSRTGLLAMLGELKLMLLRAYPDCAPLRQQIRRIDMTVLLLGRATS